MKAVPRMLDSIPRPTPAMVMALLALLIACSGAAVASIPDSDGTITACRDGKSGALRVIDSQRGQACKANEVQLDWKDGITGKVADSQHADRTENAANADTVDGKHATDFYAQGSKVADSIHADSATSAGDASTLDGKDAAQFANASHTHSGADITNGTVDADRMEDGSGSGLDADTLDGLDSTELGAAGAVNVGHLELPVPPSGGETNSGTVFKTPAFEIRGVCMNDVPGFDIPVGKLLLVAKQPVTPVITYSPERSNSLIEDGLANGGSIEVARTQRGFTYGSYFADAARGGFSPGGYLQGDGTVWILGDNCRFSATGMGQ